MNARCFKCSIEVTFVALEMGFGGKHPFSFNLSSQGLMSGMFGIFFRDVNFRKNYLGSKRLDSGKEFLGTEISFL